MAVVTNTRLIGGKEYSYVQMSLEEAIGGAVLAFIPVLIVWAIVSVPLILMTKKSSSGGKL